MRAKASEKLPRSYLGYSYRSPRYFIGLCGVTLKQKQGAWLPAVATEDPVAFGIAGGGGYKEVGRVGCEGPRILALDEHSNLFGRAARHPDTRLRL